MLSGLLLALAFPPLEWVLLLPLAPVPWLVALAREESRARALLSGFLFGMAFWCASIPWIVYVVTHYGGQSPVMGIVCLAIVAAILAEWPAVVAWGMAASAPPGSPWRLAAFPLLWMASEHVRTVAYGGFPWNLTGHALYRHPIWIQSAAVWGVYGLGLAVTAVACLLAAAVVRRRLGALALAAILVAVLGAAGALRLARAGTARRVLSVALLQPNTTEEERRDPETSALAYRRLIEAAQTASESRASIILVPESALPFSWNQSETLRRDLSRVADDCCRVLFNDAEEDAAGRYYNAAHLLGPRGLLGPSYHKVHLVPFGEYVPLPKVFFFVRKISEAIGEFSAAPAPVPLRGDDVRIGVGVCYEITYPSLVRDQVASGADLLATISNDSWYGRAGAQAQHFAGAVMRAVETERYLLRAAITGISGIVDEKGRIRGELPENEAGTLRGMASLFESRTAWTRWGFWIPRTADVLAALVLLLGFVRWLPLRRRRAERSSRRLP